jgi:molybdopterin molybdotransferase
MISFEKALEIVEIIPQPLGVEIVDLSDALGRVLAEDVYADMDMPPFNKSAVDGYACREGDLFNPLEIIEIVSAGQLPTKNITTGKCSKVMTGSMIPDGADIIIMVEDVEMISKNTIRFTRPKSNTNICYRGEDIRNHDKALKEGTLIRPQEMAVLATFGSARLQVYRRPVVGIISTGDELVEPHEIPAASQIRNSNATQLVAQVAGMGAIPKYFGIAKDTESSTRAKISQGLETCDLILLTGGVSMGDFDYVPGVMSQLGVDILFRSVAIQPGRPTVFGRAGEKLLFGLPGNPVSSFVIFELLVKPVLRKLFGNTMKTLQLHLPMGQEYRRRKSVRKSFLPVKILNGEVFPVEYHGSAHINAYIFADGIVSVEIGETTLEQGQKVWFIPV